MVDLQARTGELRDNVDRSLHRYAGGPQDHSVEVVLYTEGNELSLKKCRLPRASTKVDGPARRDTPTRVARDALVHVPTRVMRKEDLDCLNRVAVAILASHMNLLRFVCLLPL